MRNEQRIEFTLKVVMKFLPAQVSKQFYPFKDFLTERTQRRYRKNVSAHWALSIYPKISGIFGTSNGKGHFGLVRPEYSRPPLKVVHFQSVGNVPFHLTKLLSPVPLFCIMFTRTITKRAVACVGFAQPECTVPLDTWHFRNFKPEFLLAHGFIVRIIDSLKLSWGYAWPGLIVKWF